jgi:16S rRNA (cytosine967-C5)-methyltransferase
VAFDTRGTAARILARVLAGKSLNTVMPELLQDVPRGEQGLTQQLCYGTLRHYPKLKAVLDQLLKKPLRNKDRDLEALLLLGLHQLDALRVPDHAAVAATVDATRSLGKTWAKGMTNAVLRRFLRERDQLLAALDTAAGFSHPPWLYQEIQQQWPDSASSIVQANNGQPPMSLRVNARLGTRDDYLHMLSQANIPATASPLCEQGIRLAQAVDVTALPGFAQGRVSVQDEAAQLAATLLGAKAGERVLDACAAPGGKSCHILELQASLGELVSADADSRRLSKVGENLERLKLQASLSCIDATAPGDQLAAHSFDRILVDAPCSASGVIRRHPDVKLLRRPGDLAQLADQQLAILTGLWPALKPGGVLLYATCSIFTQENCEVIGKFLQHQSDATHLPIEASWGEPAPFGRQLLPSESGPDGLYYAFVGKAN